MGSTDDESVESIMLALLGERQIRLDAMDAMQAKAGVLLGFSGLVAVFGAQYENPVVRALPLTTAVLTAVFSLRAMGRIRIPGIDARLLWDNYANVPGPRTRRAIANQLVSSQPHLDNVLKRVSRAVTAATLWLACSIGILAVFGIIFGDGKS